MDTVFIRAVVILSRRQESSLKIASCDDRTHDFQINETDALPTSANEADNSLQRNMFQIMISS